MSGGSPEAAATPQATGMPGDAGLVVPVGPATAAADPENPLEAPEGDTVASTRFAHASEAEMARILDFYAVRWEYEPKTFPILWNLDGDVVESFAPDFYLPELELFLEMTTLKQRLVRKKNRKLRRLRELYPAIKIKLFYARDFRAMMLKYGRLALADALSGTPGQVVPERHRARATLAPMDIGVLAEIGEPERAAPIQPLVERVVEPEIEPEPAVVAGQPVRVSPRSRSGRRRRHAARLIAAGAAQETGA